MQRTDQDRDNAGGNEENKNYPGRRGNNAPGSARRGLGNRRNRLARQNMQAERAGRGANRQAGLFGRGAEKIRRKLRLRRRDGSCRARAAWRGTGDTNA